MDLGLILGERLILATSSTESTINLWVLFIKYVWIKLRAVGKTKYQEILTIKSLWSIKSNALEISVNNAPNSFPPFTDFLKFSNVLLGNAENYILCRIHNYLLFIPGYSLLSSLMPN